MSDHTRHMRHAISLGSRHKGRTGENPSVGCVIVKDQIIIGRGITAPGGRPHAEMEALHMAGLKSEGATAYITLEPCAHEGVTPSCARILAESGISTVVTALSDPDPRTSGKGHQMLREAGIDVITGILPNEARENVRGFLSRIERGRPYFQLKMGVTSNGKIAERQGFPSNVTGSDARHYAMRLRAQCDGILIGIGTATSDDPHLTVRISGLEHTSPTRIILDPEGDLSLNSRLAQTADTTPVLLVCDKNREQTIVKKFRETEVEILGLPCEKDMINLQDLSRVLAERKMGQIMVEGGSLTASSFINAGLIDEIALFKSQKSFGDGALDALDNMDIFSILKGRTVKETFLLGDDTFTLYEMTT